MWCDSLDVFFRNISRTLWNSIRVSRIFYSPNMTKHYSTALLCVPWELIYWIFLCWHPIIPDTKVSLTVNVTSWLTDTGKTEYIYMHFLWKKRTVWFLHFDVGTDSVLISTRPWIWERPARSMQSELFIAAFTKSANMAVLAWCDTALASLPWNLCVIQAAAAAWRRNWSLPAERLLCSRPVNKLLGYRHVVRWNVSH